MPFVNILIVFPPNMFYKNPSKNECRNRVCEIAYPLLFVVNDPSYPIVSSRSTPCGDDANERHNMRSIPKR